MKKKSLILGIIIGALVLSACGKRAGEDTAIVATEEAAGQVENNTEEPEEESEKEADVNDDIVLPEKNAGETSQSEASSEAGEESLESEHYGGLYLDLKGAYDNQYVPEAFQCPAVPKVGAFYEATEKYNTVTYANLQGSWENRYVEYDVEYVEILTVNGERAKIESYADGVPCEAWNDEGDFSIEDRSADGKCPAIRINDTDGTNICTIYVRWVKEDCFFDGGFLNEWKRIAAKENMADNWNYDTVTAENLQGVWYSEYSDEGGYYQDVLVIEENTASIVEAVDRKISSEWNAKGYLEIDYVDFVEYKSYPEVIIRNSEGAAGIYVTYVDKEKGLLYDSGFNRYWIRVDENAEYVSENVENSGSDWGRIEGETYIYSIDPVEYTADNEVSSWNISVWDKKQNSFVGFIPVEIDEGTNYYPHASQLVAEHDANFDGVDDIIVFFGSFGPRSVKYEKCYLVLGGSLVECEDYDEIPEGYTDEETKTIIGNLRDGAEAYETYYYEIQGTKAVLVKTVRFEYDEDAEDYLPVN